MECEEGFSTFLTIKSKIRNCLTNPEHNFRCSVSKISPRLARKVSVVIALTYKYLLVDKLYRDGQKKIAPLDKVP